MPGKTPRSSLHILLIPSSASRLNSHSHELRSSCPKTLLLGNLTGILPPKLPCRKSVLLLGTCNLILQFDKVTMLPDFSNSTKV